MKNNIKIDAQSEGIKKKRRINSILQNRELLLIFFGLFLIIFFSIAQKRFFTMLNIFTILRQSSFMGILAIGQTMVILVGGIDLSIGMVAGLSGILVTLLMSKGFPVIVSILITLVLGIVAGLFNGILITKVRIPDFMATLASMSIAEGMIFILTKGYSVYEGITPGFKAIAGASFLHIPLPVYYMFVLFGIWIFILGRTTLGRRIYAVGGNPTSAYLSGINVSNIKIIVYMISGVGSALTGILISSRLESGQTQAGGPLLFPVITAVVLGGVSLAGGAGTLVGTLIGVIIMGILSTGMIMMGLNSYWQKVALGLILVIAIASSSFRKSKESI